MRPLFGSSRLPEIAAASFMRRLLGRSRSILPLRPQRMKTVAKRHPHRRLLAEPLEPCHVLAGQ
jgi:hypothetical protein